jgi:cell division protein FtsB
MSRLRLLLPALLLLLLTWLQYRLWFGEGGTREDAALRAQVARQQAENLALRQRNEALAAEVDALKAGGEAVEERARSELGMVRDGEVFYRVIEQDAPVPAASPPPAPQADTP